MIKNGGQKFAIKVRKEGNGQGSLLMPKMIRPQFGVSLSSITLPVAVNYALRVISYTLIEH
jgi:hypothetical protein